MATLGGLAPWRRTLAELWYTARPLLLEVGAPSFVAGCAFPLANGVVQRLEGLVGRRAGTLYLANTAGAVAGSLVAGYLLLPRLGMQAATFWLGCLAAAAILPLWRVVVGRWSPVAAVLVALTALGSWTTLPADYVLQRTRARQQSGERLVTTSEGLTEVVTVVEVPGRGRALITNGHAMSSTAALDQRYMRAMAHIPLLSMTHPSRVLVIGFGVGNTTHAATLHSSVQQVDVVDLSRHVLEQAHHFRDANHDVLHNAKVSVYVNDGRQHLRTSPLGSYDLITLEPPPIAYAGVAALYSREFYQLARSRLTAGGYISQWLPAYQVPDASSLAMVRAFVEVFPQAVLLSGTDAELLLVGTSGPRIEIDPLKVEQALSREPAVRDDLVRLDLGTPREIVGTFVGSAATLARATQGVPAAVDDQPLQEYAVLSGLRTGYGVPAALYGPEGAAAWCPRCFDGGEGASRVAGLDLYLGLLQEAYMGRAMPAPVSGHRRRLLGSTYLGAVVPDTAETHHVLGVDHLRSGRLEDAAREFEEALRRDPQSDRARASLADLRSNQGSILLEARRFVEASIKLQEAVGLVPTRADAHNDLGVALASMGRVGEALPHFQQAVTLSPGHEEARRNLAAAQAAMAD
jgi:spermidine synthase